MKNILIYIVLAGMVLASCKKDESRIRTIVPDNPIDAGWTVPVDQLVLSQLPPDRILSIDAPHFETLNDQNLKPNETAYVYRYGNIIKVYPQNILWHHEIVNDRIHDHYFSITFCPLTGSAVAWNRDINGTVTEFGVSGHLYNDNLIPYDRNSNSYWSQMLMQGIKGQHAYDELDSELLLKTKGVTIIQAFPDALVLVDTTNHQCDTLCRGFKSGNVLSVNEYFGIVNVGQIKEPEALLFSFDNFEGGIKVYQTYFKSAKLIVAGSKSLNFIVAFIDNTGNADIEFYPLQGQLPVIMKDNHGNRYDLTGNVVSGPDKGTRLSSPDAYFARGFAWELLFGNHVVVFEGGND